MNYDTLAAMSAKELRKGVRNKLRRYNELTKSNITPQVVRRAPKARLLYMECRFWAEVDVNLKWEKMKEELDHRAALLRPTTKRYVIHVTEEVA